MAQKVRCHKCNSDNESDAIYCIFCGKLLDTLVSCTMRLMAYVSKADGIITKSEAIVVSNLLDSISGNDSSFRNISKNIFNTAKSENIENYKQVASVFYLIAGKELGSHERENFLNHFTRWLIFLVYADGKLNQKQSNITNEIASILNINRYYLKALYEEFNPNKNDHSTHEQKQEYKERKNTLDECYEILKCSKNSTNDEIKNSYRTMVKHYHPDMIQGKGLTEDFIFFANQKLKDINSAYETIRVSRGF